MDPFEIFAKPPSIDVEINSNNTANLINDLKDYSGPFLKSKVAVNVEAICEQVENILPAPLVMEEILAGYDASEKESLLIK